MPIPVSLLVALATAPVAIQPGKEGDIVAWLVAGPYPNEGALQLRGTGFATDYLKSEAAANPKEGDVSGSQTWRLAVGRDHFGIDLQPPFNNATPAIGYTFTNVISPRDQSAYLLFGSDDGAKVYLNGQKIFERQIARGVKRDEERVPLSLKAGVNRLLFKIEQGDGGWGLVARVVGSNDQPLAGVSFSLDLNRTGDQGALSWLRQATGKPGTFDLFAAQDWFAAQDRLERFHRRFGKSALVKGEVGEQALRKAKSLDLNQESATATSETIRKSLADLEAAYRTERAPLQALAQKPKPLFPNVKSRQGDWISVMPGGRYFQHGKNVPFLPLGYNHNPDWTELGKSNPLSDEYDPKATDRWFAKLRASGVNMVRLMAETPQSGNLEEAPGVFRYEHMIWLDHIVTAARKHGIRLMVTPYDTFWMNLRAEYSPYWAANGGPIREKVQFLTDPKVIALQKGRMKWLIDRYGNLDTIFCWEIMNEIDLWWGASPAQIRDWANQMAPFVRRYQKAKWSKGPLLSLSMAEPKPKGINADTAFRRSDLDFSTMHLYLGKTKAPNPGDEEQAGDDFADGVTYARDQVRDNRPVFDGESGPIDRWVADINQDNRLYHEMSWSHLMAGGAGPGTRWPYRGPHHITDGMLETVRSMRKFMDGVDWRRLNGKMTPIVEAPGVEFRVRGFSTEKAAICRYQNRGKAQSLLVPGAKSIRLFDITTGKWLEKTPGNQVQLPASLPDVAVYAIK